MAAHKILSTREALIEGLREFYVHRPHFEALAALVGKRPTISLRLLDHFVYNYSRTRGVQYEIPGRQLPFIVYVSYKQNLGVQGKLLFDAFGRHERATLRHGDDAVVTSAGQARARLWCLCPCRSAASSTSSRCLSQANLVRWAISNRVLDYVERNVADIRADLRATCMAKKQARAADKAAGIKKRRADRSFHHKICIHAGKKFRPACTSPPPDQEPPSQIDRSSVKS